MISMEDVVCDCEGTMKPIGDGYYECKSCYDTQYIGDVEFGAETFDADEEEGMCAVCGDYDIIFSHTPQLGKLCEVCYEEMDEEGKLNTIYGAETFEATDVGKRMKCRGCSQWEFVRGVPMNNFLQDDKGKWRCYDCLYDKPKHKVVVIGRGKHKPFVSGAETFETKGIDTFTEPFSELKSGSILNKAILLGSLGVGAMIGLKLRK